MMKSKKTIPCINCLVYAACRNKTNISCKLLYDWYDAEQELDDRIIKSYEIEELLPDVSTLTHSKIDMALMFVNALNRQSKEKYEP